MGRMKVLHVIDSSGMYGAEKVLLNLVAEQVSIGLYPEIASIGEKGIKEKPLEHEARRLGLPLTIFRMRPGPNVVGAIGLRNYAVRNCFDVYHSHGYKGDILIGLMPSFFRQLPVISTLHGYTSTVGINKMRVYEWVDRAVIPRMDAVVLVSEKMKNNIKNGSLSKANYCVIENGIPAFEPTTDKASDPIFHQVAEFCENGFIVGAVGRLSPEKGFHFLIEAFSEVIKNCPKTKLLLMGEGGMRDSIINQIRQLGLEERVFMTGYVEDAVQLMSFFDLFVLPSITEGLPIALLEAMQQGIPSVCTRAGGVLNVLKHEENGLLVNIGDPIGLALAIRRLYEDKTLRNQLGKKAKENVQAKHSSRNMALQYRTLYYRVCNSEKAK